MQIEDNAYKVDKEDVLAIQKELEELHEREAFEKQVYFRQTRKLSGQIVQTLNEISAQEEKHAYLLEVMLKKANLPVKKFESRELASIVDYPLLEALKFSIEQEKISVEAYKKAIEKASDEIKEVLEHILQEELEHIGRLRHYLEEHTK